MSLHETMRSVEAGATIELATITYAESVAARVPVPGFDIPEPTEDDLATAHKALRDRKWLNDQGQPAGPLLTFASLGARPGARMWFWESSSGTALIILAVQSNATGLARPHRDHPGIFTLTLQPLRTVTQTIADDAWHCDRTTLAAPDLGGQILPITLDRTGRRAKMTAPKEPEQPPIAHGFRSRIPTRQTTVDQQGYTALVTTAFENPLWGLDADGRSAALSLGQSR